MKQLTCHTLLTSNLVRLPSPEKAVMIGKLNIRLSKAFWLYLVLTLALHMVLTLILVVVSARCPGIAQGCIQGSL